MKPRTLIQEWLRTRALRPGRARDLYRRLFNPRGEEWAELLRHAGHFHHMGEGCSIQSNVTITDPQLVSMGNNVRLSGCTLFGHDGSVNMVNHAFGLKLDSVGPIVIGDDVFIGHGAIVLPGVRIGSRVIVAAGAVVSRDVPDNSVVAGVPARVVKTLEDHVEDLELENEGFPWRPLVEQREHGFDPRLEPTLLRMRKQYFFGTSTATPAVRQEPRRVASTITVEPRRRLATSG